MNNREKYLGHLREFQEQMKKSEVTHLTNYEVDDGDDDNHFAEEANSFDDGFIFMDTIYLMQNQYCVRVLKHILDNPRNKEIFQNQEDINCLDVGSQISLVTFLATFSPFYYLEPRLPQSGTFLEMKDLNLTLLKGEAQNIPLEDSSLKIITSLHAIEHFGLGRYGDQIDYLGDVNGLKEYSRLLEPGGFLVCSVPVTSKSNEKIIFNKNRSYSCETFLSMIESAGLDCRDKKIILPPLNELVGDNGYPLITSCDENGLKIVEQITDSFISQNKPAPDFALMVVAQKNG